jgi:hypothetical protein
MGMFVLFCCDCGHKLTKKANFIQSTCQKIVFSGNAQIFGPNKIETLILRLSRKLFPLIFIFCVFLCEKTF